MEVNTKTEHGSFKKKKVYFTQVSNNAVLDKELSMKAKGLYSIIQHFITIENFKLYKNHLRKQCKEGKKCFDSSWLELKTLGYLKQEKIRGEKGQYTYEYELLDIAKPLETKDSVQAPKKVGMDKKSNDHTPIKESMDKGGIDKGGTGKGGPITILDLNNKEINDTNPNNNRDWEKVVVEKEGGINISEIKEKTKVIRGFINESFTDKEIHEFIKVSKGSIDLIKTQYENSKHSTKPIKNYFTWMRSAIKNNYKVAIVRDDKRTSDNTGSFNNYEQRIYDYVDLENKLLGYDGNE
jgi:hypothetical protein